jgi:hypothetical protein
MAISLSASAQELAKPTPLVIFEHHTLDTGDGGIVFTLSLFGDGRVVFVGKNRTRVIGEATDNVGSQKAEAWAHALIRAGALEVKEGYRYAPPPDSDWSRLTISADGRSNSYRFHRWNRSHPPVQVIDEMMRELDVDNRWVGSMRDSILFERP